MRKLLAAVSALALLAPVLAEAQTFTTNYNWTKPTVGASTNAWGTNLNGDLDGIDSTVFGVSGVANAACPKAGCTITGNFTVDGVTTFAGLAAFTASAPSGNPSYGLASNVFLQWNSGANCLYLNSASGEFICLDTSGNLHTNGSGAFIGPLTGNVTGSVTGNVTGNVSGNAGGTSSSWANSITLSLGGDLSGSVSFNGSSNVTLNGTVGSASTSTAGKVALATGAQVVAGSDTTHAVTPASLTSAQSLGAGGCTTLPGGLIEQWGYVSGPFANNATSSVTFAASTCAFTSAVYNVQFTADVTGFTPSNSPYAVVTTGSPSTFGVNTTIQGFQSGGGGHIAGYWWFAVGK